MNVLITGGAGYIGSHCSKTFAQHGFVAVVYDNLSRGHRSFATWGPLEHCPGDPPLLISDYNRRQA